MAGLEAILRYKMTDHQAAAYKVGLMFTKMARELFPDYKLGNRRSGDPRESELFKFALKAITENAGRLRPHEYKFYVFAQLAVAKASAAAAGTDPLIWPGLLAGPRAWRRWSYWKKRNSQLVSSGSAKVSERKPVDIEYARRAILSSRDFLASMLKVPDAAKIRWAMASGSLPRWVAVGNVSGYVPLLSPTVSRWLKDSGKTAADAFGPGIDTLRNDLCGELEEAYRTAFPKDTA